MLQDSPCCTLVIFFEITVSKVGKDEGIQERRQLCLL